MAKLNDDEDFDFDIDYDYDYKNPDKKEEKSAETGKITRDSNGNILSEADSVTVIKGLKVRGSSMVIKRGTKVKSIRLTENIEEVEGKVEGSWIVLRAEFLKKA